MWYTIFNSSFRRVGATDKGTFYSFLRYEQEKGNEFELFKQTESFESKIL